MNSIEEDLKQALKRQEPPADFAGKVMDRVNSGAGLEPEKRPGPNKVLVFRLKPKVVLWLATAAAAACVLGLFTIRSYVAGRGSVEVAGPVSTSNQLPRAATPQPSDARPNPEPSILGGNEIGRGRRQIGAGALRPAIRRSRVISHRGAGTSVPDEARRAEEQLRLALAIASAKLGYAQRSIQEADGTNSVDRGANP